LKVIFEYNFYDGEKRKNGGAGRRTKIGKVQEKTVQSVGYT